MFLRQLHMIPVGIALALSAPAIVYAQAQHGGQDHRSSQQQSNSQRPQTRPASPPRSTPNYGNWDTRWGARPPAPPRHWSRTSDWYRHVRACQQRYQSYSARTDVYRTSNGRSVRCPL